MRSDILKKGIETLPHRALLMSAGLKKEDFDLNKPFIGVQTVTITSLQVIFT